MGIFDTFFGKEKTQDEILQELATLSTRADQIKKEIAELDLQIAQLSEMQRPQFQKTSEISITKLAKIKSVIAQKCVQVSNEKKLSQKTAIASCEAFINTQSKVLAELVTQIKQVKIAISTSSEKTTNVHTLYNAAIDLPVSESQYFETVDTNCLSPEDIWDEIHAAELAELKTTAAKEQVVSIDVAPLEQKLADLSHKIKQLTKLLESSPKDGSIVVYQNQLTSFRNELVAQQTLIVNVKQNKPIPENAVKQNIDVLIEAVTALLQKILHNPFKAEITEIKELISSVQQSITQEFEHEGQMRKRCVSQQQHMAELLQSIAAKLEEYQVRIAKLHVGQAQNQAEEQKIRHAIQKLSGELKNICALVIQFEEPIVPIKRKIRKSKTMADILAVMPPETKIFPPAEPQISKVEKEYHITWGELAELIANTDQTKPTAAKKIKERARRIQNSLLTSNLLDVSAYQGAISKLKILQNSVNDIVTIDSILSQLDELQISLNVNLYGLNAQAILSHITSVRTELLATEQNDDVSEQSLQEAVKTATEAMPKLQKACDEFLQSVEQAKEKVWAEKVRAKANVLDGLRANYKSVRDTFLQEANAFKAIELQMSQHFLIPPVDLTQPEIERIIGSTRKTVEQLSEYYPTDIGKLSVGALNRKIKNLNFALKTLKAERAQQENKLNKLDQDLQAQMSEQAKEVWALLKGDHIAFDAAVFASFNIPANFAQAVVFSDLLDNQKTALYLVYLGLKDTEKSLLTNDQANWQTALDAICKAILTTADDPDEVMPLSGADAKTLAGVYLLKLTNPAQDIKNLYEQYHKYAEGVEKINQAWNSYLDKHNQPANPVGHENVGREVVAAEDKSKEVTEANKVAAVRRIQEPLNKPEWIANPLRKLKEFDKETVQPKNNILLKHRHPALSVILAILGTIGFPTLIRSYVKYGHCYSFLRPDSKQVFLATGREAADVMNPVPAAPRLAH